VLFWTSRGHLSAAFVEVIRGRLPLHRADRQLRVQCRILEGTMKIERVFRISPALVRVILRDRPVSTNVVEGYLPRARGKTQFVRLEAAGSHLVLQVSSDGGTLEERTKIPTAQAEALLQVSEGKIGYRRSQLRIGIEVDATLDRFEQPAGLDLVVLQFADQNEADGFSPLPWLGPEVTSEDRFSRRTLAVAGAPIEEAVEASNRSLIALVEMLEQSGGLRHLSAPALGTSLQTSVGPASETQAEEAPSRRARLPVRLPEQVRFPRANDELVANAVVDARLPDVFEAMSRELSPAPVEASPNTMVAEEVEIKRSGRNLKDLLRRAKSTS
jgi:CYTH domain-containing protein